MNELDPTHQAVAEQARARVMELINKSKVIIADVILGDMENQNDM